MNAIYSEAGEAASIEMLCEIIPPNANQSLGSSCTTNSECISGMCNNGQCIGPCDPNSVTSCAGGALTCQLIQVFDQPVGQDDLLAWFCMP